MEIRPYKLICGSELALISQRLREVWSAWCAHWLPGLNPESVTCVPADADPNRLGRSWQQWRRFSLAQSGKLSIAIDDMLPTRLAALAFGNCVPQFGPSGTGPSRLVVDLMNAMLGELAVRVFQASGQSVVSAEELVQDASEPEPHAWKRGSGAACVALTVGGKPLHALLDEAMVRAIVRELRPPIRPQEAPSPRHACLGAQPVRLELWAGETQIELGVLQSLVPGDVILLDVRISEPLRVAIDGKPTGRYAYLGRSGERKALQLRSANRS